MNHEQFALLQSPHMPDPKVFIKVGKECKLISKKKKNYVKQLDAAERDSPDPLVGTETNTMRGFTRRFLCLCSPTQ